MGVKVANAAIALGMKVIGYDNFINTERAWELSSAVEKAPSLEPFCMLMLITSASTCDSK